MENDIAVYVHWPFCQAKCPYCDFNSHVQASVDYDRWARAFISEISRTRAEIGERRLISVFFGGGTPSLMPPDLVAGILEALRAAWPVANDYEVTLEANPTSVEAGRFRGYRDAGVNRISIGIQSLRDDHLRALGRLHTAAEAKEAIAVATNTFDRVSGDLIYARQNQSLHEWEAELDEALALGLDHMSLYQLTIEDGTAFGDRYRAGRLRGLPGEDLSADLYEATQTRMEAAGFETYETSNHARTGAESLHNLVYWRGGEYLGIGPGAHGRLRHARGWVATIGRRMPTAWLEAVEQSGSGEEPREQLSDRDRAVEYVMMSLRLAEGSQLDRVPDGVIRPEAVNELIDEGFLWKDEQRFGTTRTGRPLLNAILARLLT